MFCLLISTGTDCISCTGWRIGKSLRFDCSLLWFFFYYIFSRILLISLCSVHPSPLLSSGLSLTSRFTFGCLWIRWELTSFFIGRSKDGLVLTELLFFLQAASLARILLKRDPWDRFCQNIFYLLDLSSGFKEISSLKISDF